MILLSLTIFALACKSPTEVVVLSLNDVHAQIDNFDKIAAYVASQRAQHRHVIVLFAGDMFSGNPMVDYHAERGYPIVELFNHIGLTACTLGNHEFDYGQKVLVQRIAQANYPFLCANAHGDSSTVAPHLRPTLAYPVGSDTLLLIGVTQHNPECLASRKAGVAFDEPIERIGCDSVFLSAKKNNTTLIAITHIGFALDTLLAHRCPQLDLIVGGHTHTVVDTGYWANGVLVTQTGAYARNIGRTTLAIKHGKVIAAHNSLVNVASLQARDTAVTALIARYNNNPTFSTVVSHLPHKLDSKEQVGNYFCRIVQQQTKSDIVFQNLQGIRVEGLEAGNMLLKDLYRVDPFSNQLVQFQMTGSQIKSFVRKVSQHFRRMDLCAAGMEYSIVWDEQKNVKDIVFKSPLSNSKIYTVTMNEYMCTTPADYPLPDKLMSKNLNITTIDCVLQSAKK